MDTTPFASITPAPTPETDRRANPGDEKTIDPADRRRRALEAIAELGDAR